MLTRKLVWLLLLTSIHALNAWPSAETILQSPKTISSAIITTLKDIYHWRQPDVSLPSLEELNVVTFIPVSTSSDTNSSQDHVLKLLTSKTSGNLIVNGTIYEVYRGIPEKIKTSDAPISVYSGGYSNNRRPYAYCGYTSIKAGLVPGACVTFDFATDTRRAFNFCQEQDLHCIKTVCNEIVKAKPNASLILHGACKGAANNLRFLAEQAERSQQEECLKNIKAVICESPPISVKKALSCTPLAPVTLALMPLVLPNYNPEAKTIMDAKKFPAIPVMIGSLPKDTISNLDDVIAMNNHLIQNCGATVTLFVSEEDKIIHGEIGKAVDYQNSVTLFLNQTCESSCS